MQKENWQKIEEIFNAAAELNGTEREEYLKIACAESINLFSEVSRLLEEHERDNSFLEKSIFETGLKIITESKPSEGFQGKSLGHYQVERLIGKGGMGEVYLAMDSKLFRRVAIKILNEEFAVDAEHKQRFRKEARAASLVSHPNVAQIYELGETDERNFIVMEYVEGLNLRQYSLGKKFKLSELLDFIQQISAALKAAYAAGVIHRDIKPENVIIKSDGSIKVLDFGLAKLFEPGMPKSLDHQTLIGSAPTTGMLSTEMGTFLGTPSYMSPEQVRGIEIDNRTDIWSLGVMFYEMLTGELPFQGAMKMDVIAAILTKEPFFLSQPDSQLPDSIVKILKKCLSKEKQYRYQSITDFSTDLNFLSLDLQPGTDENYFQAS